MVEIKPITIPRSTVFEKVVSKLSNFFLKIKKIFQYLPLLCKDEDWDFNYLLYLITFKLKRMKKAIKEGYAEEEYKKAVLASIDETLLSIDNYLNAYDVFEDINGCIHKKLNCEHFFTGDEDGFYTSGLRYKNTKEKISKEHEEEYRTYLRDMDKFESELWDSIWDNIKEHGRTWWN